MAAGKKTGGRKKGTPNRTTAQLKDAILLAAEQAGGKDGMVGYLTTLATETPTAFAGLLGKVLPMQVSGDDDGGPVRIRAEVCFVSPSRD